MEKYSWIFDVLDLDLVREVGPKKIAGLTTDVIGNRLKSENEKNLLKCALCPNMCEFACPVLETEGRETVSPSRKAKLGYFYTQDNLEASEIGENIYYCLSCDACKQNCPLDLSVCDLLVPVRESFYNENDAPDAVREIEKNLENTDTIFKEFEGSEHDGEKTGTGRTLYFRSCVARKETPGNIDATIELLNSMNKDYQILEKEICCGGPAKSLGIRDTFTELAERNVDMFNDSGADEIICSCPTCTYMLREVYPDYGFEIEPEIYHITEYLAENLDKDASFKLDEAKSLTYHDPCTLARKLEVVEEPREILSKIQNLTLKEPYFNKEDTHCCGRGGSLKLIDEELENDIAEKRGQSLNEHSNIVITSCPSCKMTLNKSSDNLEVLDISEILAECL